MRVNKAELAQILAVSLPTLNALIVRHGDAFPVLAPGGPGRDWAFESEAVVSFLDARKAEEAAADTERQMALRQAMLPLGHNGGPPLQPETAPVRPAELLALMKVRRMQREEEYACGRLVEAHKVAAVLGDQLASFSRELHQSLRRFGRERDLPDDLIDALDAELTAVQQRHVEAARRICQPSAKQASLFGDAAG